MHDMRNGAKALYSGSRHRDGYRAGQSGPWDDRFLCEAHEAAFAVADDYAIRLSRRVEAGDVRQHRTRKAVIVDNPHPDRLLLFAYATVWRHVMAPSCPELHGKLGPHEQGMRQALFESGPLKFDLIVVLSNISAAGGKPIKMGLAPYQQQLGSWKVWHFICGGLEYYLKVSNQGFPSKFLAVVGAQKDPLVLTFTQPVDIATAPLFSEIAARIRATPRRFPS